MGNSVRSERRDEQLDDKDVGGKAEDYGALKLNYVFVISRTTASYCEFQVVSGRIVAYHIRTGHIRWLRKRGRGGRKRCRRA